MRMLTPRQMEALSILNGEKRPMDPRDVADALTKNGIPSHPSAAARALRKLAHRGLVQTRHEFDEPTFGGPEKPRRRVPLNKELRKVSMGADAAAIETTSCYLYELSR